MTFGCFRGVLVLASAAWRVGVAMAMAMAMANQAWRGALDGRAWAGVGFVLAAAVGLAPCARAQGKGDANPMSPGAWELSTSAKAGTGREPGPARVDTVCVDQGWIDAQKVYEAGSADPVRGALSCKTEGYGKTEGRASWTTSCAMRNGAQARVSYERRASADRLEYATEATVSGGGAPARRVSIETTMRRVGASCPPGARKLTAPPAPPAPTAPPAAAAGSPSLAAPGR